MTEEARKQVEAYENAARVVDELRAEHKAAGASRSTLAALQRSKRLLYRAARSVPDQREPRS